MNKRLIALVLAFVLAVSCLSSAVSAQETISRLDFVRKTQATKKTPFDGAYVYPYATSVNAAGIEGGTLLLQFRSNKNTPNSDDIFFVDIYSCNKEQLFDMTYDPNLIYSKEYKMSQFSGSPKSLGVTVSMDHFKAGVVYCYVCGVADRNGEVYDQQFFFSDLYVASSKTYVYSLSFLMSEDYDFEYTNNAVSTEPGKTKIILPVPNPLTATKRTPVTAECANTKIATVKVDSGYIYVTGVGVGKTELSVQYGKAKATIPVYVGGLENLTVYPMNTTLCVGQTDEPVVSSVPDCPVYMEWTSEDPKIATVVNGIITAVSPGTTTIRGDTVGYGCEIKYTVRYHDLPEGTPVTVRTATQPKQAVGHCSICGKDDAVNIYEPAIFTDTKATAWYAEHVDNVFDLGLMNGTSEHTFAPNANVNRAMAATVLYRIAGEPEIEGESPFNDVPAGKYFTNAVIWAEQNGIVNGYPDGTFRPDVSITREQLAAILYRYAGSEGKATAEAAVLDEFPDAYKVHSYAQDAMGWAVGAELINGVGSDGKSYLQPANNASRAQFATIISRYMTTVYPLTPEEQEPQGDPSEI